MVITVMMMMQYDYDHYENCENYSIHRINVNDDDAKIPTMTPIPEENAFASSAPLEAGSPLG